MKVLMLDTQQVIELDEIEAVRRIRARCAVEAVDMTLGTLGEPPAPESAMLDRARTTAVKPRPQPRPAPPREKRRKKR
jgi:hypothetical protein